MARDKITGCKIRLKNAKDSLKHREHQVANPDTQWMRDNVAYLIEQRDLQAKRVKALEKELKELESGIAPTLKVVVHLLNNRKAILHYPSDINEQDIALIQSFLTALTNSNS